MGSFFLRHNENLFLSTQQQALPAGAAAYLTGHSLPLPCTAAQQRIQHTANTARRPARQSGHGLRPARFPRQVTPSTADGAAPAGHFPQRQRAALPLFHPATAGRVGSPGRLPGRAGTEAQNKGRYKNFFIVSLNQAPEKPPAL